MEKEVMKLNEAAIYLNLSIDTVRRWAKSGKIRSSKNFHGHYLFKISDLQPIREEITKGVENV